MRLVVPFLALLVLVFATPASASGKPPGLEKAIFDAVMLHCVAPVIAGDSPARLAAQSRWPEFSPEQSSALMKGYGGGRSFAIPAAMGYGILFAANNGMCGVAIRELDPAAFWPLMDPAFAPGSTPWTLVSSKEENGGTTKTYESTRGRPAMAIVSARNQPLEGGMQGLVTISPVSR